MGRPIATKLRNQSQKTGAATRKKDPLDLEDFPDIEEFLKRWRFHLKTPGTEWEEPLAVAELKKKKVFAFLLCEGESATWMARDLFGRIVEEIEEYRKEASNRLMGNTSMTSISS